MKKRLVNSQMNNYKTYLMYQRRMITLAENVFQFKNLPTFIDKHYLNATLLLNGSIAFFYDEELQELVALPYSIIGNLDLYGRPVKIMARGYNGRFYKSLKKDEFIIMYDNNGRYPIYLDICQIAERIAFGKRTIDINIGQQRTPRVWTTTEDKKLSLKSMMEDIDGFMDNILTYDSINLDDLNCVLDPAPYVADKIDLHLKEEWAEFYQLIGINSLTTTKKERLITDEVMVSQGGTIASRFNRFEPRKDAIEQINEKWGNKLNKKIEVVYFDGEPSTEQTDEREVEKNVSILSLDSENSNQ